MFAISQYLNEAVPISCEDAADVNDDGKIDISDLVYWSTWRNMGGAEPKAPGTKAIGVDPTADNLSCAQYPKTSTPATPAQIPGTTPTPAATPTPTPTPKPTTSPTPTSSPTPAQTPITQTQPTLVTPKFLRGDINSDGKIDITDMFAISQYLNEAVPISCEDAADVNDDGKIDISDLVYWSTWRNMGGAEPKTPGTKVLGIDPTSDNLSCAQYPKTSTPTTPTQTQPVVVTPKFLRGDNNADGKIDITDMFAISQYLNESAPISCEDSADVNDDGAVDISDLAYWSTWWNQGGAAPKAPGTKVLGVDPTADNLSCVQYPKS